MDVEEDRRQRVVRVPPGPTQHEIDEHLPLHVKFRAWCPVCVKAAGAHDPRTSHADETTGITLKSRLLFHRVHRGDNDGVDTCEAEASDMIKVLVLYDHHLKAIHATQVMQKEPLEEVTGWVLQRLDVEGTRAARSL